MAFLEKIEKFTPAEPYYVIEPVRLNERERPKNQNVSNAKANRGTAYPEAATERDRQAECFLLRNLSDRMPETPSPDTAILADAGVCEQTKPLMSKFTGVVSLGCWGFGHSMPGCLLLAVWPNRTMGYWKNDLVYPKNLVAFNF